MSTPNGQRELDQFRKRVALVITAVWVLGAIANFFLPTSTVFTGSQALMLLVAGWLFVGPAVRGNGKDHKEN